MNEQEATMRGSVMNNENLSEQRKEEGRRGLKGRDLILIIHDL